MALNRTPLRRKKALGRGKRLRRTRAQPKSRLAKAKARPGSRYWRDRADPLWAQVIRRKNNGRCLYCGEPAINAHHLVDREVGHLRHSLMNGIPLCYQHHTGNARFSAHRAPIAFAEWLKDKHPDVYEWVQEHNWEVAKPDYRSRYEELRGILAAHAGREGEDG